MKIAIIGGVAGGTGAGARAYRVDPEAHISLYEAGSYISYAGCGLPYYLSGEIKAASSLVAFSPERFQVEKGVEVFTRHLVQAIWLKEQRLLVEDLETQKELQIAYDRLIIASGAVPIVPPLPGREKRGVFTLRTLADALALKEELNQGKGKQAVIIGGGAVGVEMAETFVKLRLNVLLLERGSQILPFLDGDMALIVQKHLEAKGVQVQTGAGVKGFLGEARLMGVETEAGKTYPARLALLAVGIRPRIDLVQRAGLKLGATGALWVDERMATSEPHVFGAGDCCETTQLVTGKSVWMPLGSTANRQARVAGTNAAGGSARFQGVLGTALVKVLDYHVGRTGLNTAEATAAAFDFFTVKIEAKSNAGYYPDSGYLNLKLVVEGGGRLLGAQIIGTRGVDKRIDVAATAIYNGMNVKELAALDLGYAPPYSNPIDPLQVAGRVAVKKIN